MRSFNRAGLYLTRYFITFFQLCTLLLCRDFNLLGILGLYVAWYCDSSVTNSIALRLSNNARRDLVTFLTQFRTCQFTHIPIDDAVGPEVAVKIVSRSIGCDRQTFLQKANEWWTGKKLSEIGKDRMHIYVVTAKPGCVKPSSLVSFPCEGGAYIFLTNSPQELRGAGRFFLLHELGHALMTSIYFQTHSAFYSSRIRLAFFWVATQLAVLQIPEKVLFKVFSPFCYSWGATLPWPSFQKKDQF